MVINTLPRERQRATLHHAEQYPRIRSHVMDFLMLRAARLGGGLAPAHFPMLCPGLLEPPTPARIHPRASDGPTRVQVVQCSVRPSDSPSLLLQRETP